MTTSFRFGRAARAVLLFASLVTTGALAGPQGSSEEPVLAPADPAAEVPPVRFSSTFSAQRRDYVRGLDAERLPWRGLFEPDGRFAPEPDGGRVGLSPGRAGSAALSPHAHSGQPGAASDARAVVKSVDRERGKVKLKHGPIPKLEMPGMTMVFRVKDPRVLEGVEAGDEVGFTVELEGTTFFVTGFQR